MARLAGARTAPRIAFQAAAVRSFHSGLSTLQWVVIEVVADPLSSQSPFSLQPGGRCVIRSIYFGNARFPHFELYTQGVTVESGLAHVTPHVRSVLDLLSDGRR